MKTIILNCLVYDLLAATALLLLLRRNPRYLMQDYPEEITSDVGERTPQEKRESLLFGIPFVAILVLYPTLFGLYSKFIAHYSFMNNWLAILALLLSFNVIDLLILDWLIFCLITPKFVVIPGTEGHPGYKNYWFHFVGFLKGCGYSLAASAILASFAELTGFLAG